MAERRQQPLLPQFTQDPPARPPATAEAKDKDTYAAFVLGNFAADSDPNITTLRPGSDLWGALLAWEASRPAGDPNLHFVRNIDSHAQTRVRTRARIDALATASAEGARIAADRRRTLRQEAADVFDVREGDDGNDFMQVDANAGGVSAEQLERILANIAHDDHASARQDAYMAPVAAALGPSTSYAACKGTVPPAPTSVLVGSAATLRDMRAAEAMAKAYVHQAPAPPPPATGQRLVLDGHGK